MTIPENPNLRMFGLLNQEKTQTEEQEFKYVINYKR